MRMRAGNRKRFCTTLLVGAAALSLGCEVAKEAKSDCGSIAANVSERHLFLLPVRWPRPSPSNKQKGLPVEATHAAVPADNPQTPAKIPLGEKLFFNGRLSADGTVACSTCHNPAHAFTDGRPEGVST